MANFWPGDLKASSRSIGTDDVADILLDRVCTIYPRLHQNFRLYKEDRRNHWSLVSTSSESPFIPYCVHQMLCLPSSSVDARGDISLRAIFTKPLIPSRYRPSKEQNM